ncbi:MAG: hypothetical protein MK364_10745, partial [Pirellulales bacterium]|nr:hypothetical protein [Pirellulales bacterium]
CRRNGPFFDPITHNLPFTSKYVVCDPHLPFRFTMASGEPTDPGHILAPAIDTGNDTHYRGCTAAAPRPWRFGPDVACP